MLATETPQRLGWVSYTMLWKALKALLPGWALFCWKDYTIVSGLKTFSLPQDQHSLAQDQNCDD